MSADSTPTTAVAPRLARDFERLVLWLRPDGWQARARRNAWAAMVADHQRRSERSAVDPDGTGRSSVRSSLQAQVQ